MCQKYRGQSRRFCDVCFSVCYHNTGHYHVRLGPVYLAPSCARIAYDRRNRGSSGVLSSTG